MTAEGGQPQAPPLQGGEWLTQKKHQRSDRWLCKMLLFKPGKILSCALPNEATVKSF